MERARHLDRRWIGRAAEAAAADYFFVSGYQLIGANVRAGPLEVDLLAEHSDLLVVVEVRARHEGSLESAIASVRRRKREQIRSAIERLWRQWLKQREHIQRIRFDVVAVTLTHLPEGISTDVEHIEAAF